MIKMNSLHKYVKNAFFLVFMQIANASLSLLLSIELARELGDISFGKYSFAIVFTSFFMIFADLGYNTLLIREVARDKVKTNKYLNNILGIRFLISMLLFIIMSLIINLLKYPDDTKIIIYGLGLFNIISSFSGIFKVTFRAFERMEFEALTTILSNLLRSIMGIAILLLGGGILDLIIIFIIISIMELIINIKICKRWFAKPKLNFNFSFFLETLKIALPLGALSIIGLMYTRIDTLMLSAQKGDAVVGWYNAAYNLILSFKPIPQLIMNVLFPAMSYYSINSVGSLNAIYSRIFRYLFIIGLPLALGISLRSEQIIITLYGEMFINSSVVLKVLSWDSLLIFLYTTSAFVLVSTDKQKIMSLIAASSLIVNFISNLILIPRFSYLGSAIATIISETFLLVSYLYLCHKYGYGISYMNFVPKSIIACMVMGVFLYLTPNLELIIDIVLSVVIYFLTLILINGFDDSDMAILKSLTQVNPFKERHNRT